MRQLRGTVNDLYFNMSTGTPSIGSTDTTFTVESGEVSSFLTALSNLGTTMPTWASLDSEDVEITSASSSGDTLVVGRGKNGTSAAAHTTPVKLNIYNNAAKHVEHDDMDVLLGKFLSLSWGAGDGVAQGSTALTGSTSEMEVTPQAVEDMTALVAIGYGFVSNRPVELASATSTTAFTLPSTGTDRIDVVQISQYDVVSTVVGTESTGPSAPSVSSGSMKLAEVYIPSTALTIGATADGTNGYITDGRVYV